MEEWSGIADADRHLGQAFPLPRVVMPLARWVDVRPVGADGVEVEWNLDDSRPGSRGRLALFAGRSEPPERPWEVPVDRVTIDGADAEHRMLELHEADPALRPAHELRWRRDALHLRLTAQGPWDLEELLRIGASLRT